MSNTIRKPRTILRTALAGLALAIAVPTVAAAANPFTDVPGGQFYTDAVDWAFNNGITTGTSPTTFSPVASVTRGENITFAKRYDDNIVQPALAEVDAKIAVLEASQPTVYKAVVAADGTLHASSSAGITLDKAKPGAYDVNFPVDVTACAWSATLVNVPVGLVIIVGQPEAHTGSIGLARDFDGIFPTGKLDSKGIFVETTDSADTNTDRGFHLVVTC